MMIVIIIIIIIVIIIIIKKNKKKKKKKNKNDNDNDNDNNNERSAPTVDIRTELYSNLMQPKIVDRTLTLFIIQLSYIVRIPIF